MSAGKPRIAGRVDEILAQPIFQGQFPVPLTTAQLAELCGLSKQYFEIGRVNGTGPEFVRLSPGVIRYRSTDVARWLNGFKAHQSTREYDHVAVAGPGRPRKAVAQ